MNLDKQQQSMENWKKEIIIDPHLNGLFDSQMTPEEFLNSKILPLPHEDIVKVYVKLTSLRHALTKNMQKEIQVRHPIIESSFQDSLRSKTQFQQIDQEGIRDNLKHIQRFNQKYQLISDRVTEIRNINKILHFAKALQKFKVNARLLKSLTKDFEKASTSHFHSELLNTMKISKIIKEISSITIRFDFSGIKSYEQQRIFLNNTKGAMFGLIEKELSAALSKLPSAEGSKKAQLQKDIMNKFVILNNIMKLKDFCIPFYKNTLKEMSELLKKSLSIGQSADERDPKTYLQTFQEYFTNSLTRRLVENGIIFISFDQLLSKSGIKTPFNFNFLDKYWENITGFMKDLIAWSIDTDTKECLKQKAEQNLYHSFATLDSKHSISKYLTSLLWRYPIIYEAMTSISNQIHLYLIKNAEIHHYDFALLKQRLLRVLLPLAQLYYRHASNFYNKWKEQVSRLKQKILTEEKSQGYLRERTIAIEHLKGDKQQQNIQKMAMRIIDWMLFSLKTKQIYDFHVDCILAIADEYYTIFADTIQGFDTENQNKEDLSTFIVKADSFIANIKRGITRGRNSVETSFQPNLKQIDSSQGILVSSSEKMVRVMRTFIKYESLIREGTLKL